MTSIGIGLLLMTRGNATPFLTFSGATTIEAGASATLSLAVANNPGTNPYDGFAEVSDADGIASLSSSTITLTTTSKLGSHSITYKATSSGGRPDIQATTTVLIQDTTAPTLSSPTATPGSTTATLNVSTNEGSSPDGANGTLYTVVSTNSSTPTAAQVIAGKDAGGAAGVFATSQAVSSTGSQSVSATGLTTSVTYYAFFVQKDSVGNTSSIAATSSFTTSNTGATLSSPSASAEGAIASNLSVSTDTGSGTLYWVISTSATPPTATQIKAGNDSTGSAAVASGNQAVSATGAQTKLAFLLSSNTTYFAYFVQHTTADSNVASASSFTTKTNLLTHPFALDDASWSKTNVTVSADATTDPGGTSTADEVVPTVTNDVHPIGQAPTVASSTAFTAAFYLHAKDYAWITGLSLTSGNPRCCFHADGGSGAIGTTSGLNSSSILSIGSGWYLCKMNFTTVDTNGGMNFYTANGDNGNVYAGDGSSGIYMWGMQLYQ